MGSSKSQGWQPFLPLRAGERNYLIKIGDRWYQDMVMQGEEWHLVRTASKSEAARLSHRDAVLTAAEIRKSHFRTAKVVKG